MKKLMILGAGVALSFAVAQIATAASTVDPVTGVKTNFPVANAFAYGQNTAPTVPNVPNGNAYGQDKASKPVLSLPDNAVGLGSGLDQANQVRLGTQP
ncbi:MAG: hypothetical protein HY272_07035 [Gammaproteobacteria bacterium]|nr:hypothetical protein [Gammaproteobacteria bacterium]